MSKRKPSPAPSARRHPFIQIHTPPDVAPPPSAKPEQLPLLGINGVPFLDPRYQRRRNGGRTYR